MNKKKDIMTIKEAAYALSVSMATIRNWTRLGRLKVLDDGKSFDRNYIERTAYEIKSGKDSRLKSRRNKKSVRGKLLYKDYIHNKENLYMVERILELCDGLTDDGLRAIMSYLILQLYDKINKTHKNIEILKDLIAELEPESDEYGISNETFSEVKEIISNDLESEEFEDTLGFIYLSLSDLSSRKKKGAYYTPLNTVELLIDRLSECQPDKYGKVIDPACGTGNFLTCLVSRGYSVKRLYGVDADPVSVILTRINMFLLDNSLTKEFLEEHFICENTLKKDFGTGFSVVLGNPPWGYEFPEEENITYMKYYRTAKKNGSESYDLFIEKGLSMIREGGLLAYVLPEALMNVRSHKEARKVICENASFGFVHYLGDVFTGVQCPSVILGLKKKNPGSLKDCRISECNRDFIINKERKIDPSGFSFRMDDQDYERLCNIENVKDAVYLTAENADYALGIVTGNNRKYLSDEKMEGYEGILRGSSISAYHIDVPDRFIDFRPEAFQQVAPERMYRAEEKLVYRFISSVPVFAYDDSGMLSLNSCNILIPHVAGLDIKYILAVLNSDICRFFMEKKFNSVKMLRSHIEAFPIPRVDKELQERIIYKVNRIIKGDSESGKLKKEIDEDFKKIYGLFY